jgi:ADP-heptose:LPS heptosyltransferase
MHKVEFFLNLTKSLGIYTNNKNYRLEIPKAVMLKADNILKEAGIKKQERFFIINPGGNWPPKRWPKKKFAGLCKSLKERYSCAVLITGSANDAELAKDIIGLSQGAAISICGKTDLKQLAAIMRKASLVVSNDSGPMHIAVSQRVPTIALFGPTSENITGPYGDSDFLVIHKWNDCDIPCYSPCDDYRCMDAISAEDVLRAAEQLL